MAKYLILGARGQLGREFVKALSDKKEDFVALGKEECDVSNLRNVLEVFETVKPKIVINCAAYNQVDKAEEDYRDAIKVNSLGVRNLAFTCNKFKAFLIHYSTDYVFDGNKENGLYTEEDKANPINEYGKSKLLGEYLLKEEIENYLIFRVSWVYGNGKQNFIYKLLQWVENSEYLKIACDEVSVPTSTKTIVEVTFKALNQELTGLYHLTNSGYASRYEWAKEVFRIKGIKKLIKPVSADIFNLPARRPRFSAMDNTVLSKVLNIEIPDWKFDLKEFLKGARG